MVPVHWKMLSPSGKAEIPSSAPIISAMSSDCSLHTAARGGESGASAEHAAAPPGLGRSDRLFTDWPVAAEVVAAFFELVDPTVIVAASLVDMLVA
jgi:hypothetical protein